jgi:hypothetical protein
MKRILLLILILSCFISCKKSSNEVVDPATAIVGKWYASTRVVVFYLKGVEVYKYTLTPGSKNSVTGDSLDKDYYIFNADGSSFVYIDSGSGYTQFGPYATRTYQLINSNTTLRTVINAPPNLSSQIDQNIKFNDSNTLVFLANYQGNININTSQQITADNEVAYTIYTRG